MFSQKNKTSAYRRVGQQIWHTRVWKLESNYPKEMIMINHPTTAATKSPIDAVDIQIIDFLRADPRTSNKQMALDIGVSESTIAQRIKSMSENNIMRVVAQRDIYADKYSIMGMAQIETAGNSKEIALEMASIEEVTSVSLCLGAPQILANVRGTDRSHLVRVLMQQIGKIANIKRIRNSICLEIIKLESGYGDLSSSLPIASTDLDDDRNRMISTLLIQNGRLSNREIARQLEVSEGNVRQRLKKMFDEKDMRLSVVCDPAALDISSAAMLKIATIPSQRDDAIQALSSREEVAFLGSMSGDFDLWCLIQSATPLATASLCDKLVGEAQGVQEFEVIPLVHNLLHRYDLVRIK